MACAARRWSTGSGTAATWSSPWVPTGRRFATASWARSLPAQPAGQERVPSLEALDTFAGSIKPITPLGTPPVMVTKLEGVDERGGKPLSVVGDLPLVVRGPYGFGRVTLIALDVDQKLFADWPDRGLFWVRALDLKHDRPDQTGGGPRWGARGDSTSPASPTSRASFASASSSSRG